MDAIADAIDCLMGSLKGELRTNLSTAYRVWFFIEQQTIHSAKIKLLCIEGLNFYSKKPGNAALHPQGQSLVGPNFLSNRI